jgi:hypothetical protein
LISGGVDCWGSGGAGQLGDGQFYTIGHRGSAAPVPVVAVDGTGTLNGVASLVSLSGGAEADSSYCAVLTSGGVDCWGYGNDGELGDGVFYTSGHHGSAVPVEVQGVSGTGTLSGVTGLTGSYGTYGGTYCALLISGGVDCWGYGGFGQLGDGEFYTSSPYGSAVPVQVEGVGGTGTLTGVASLDTAGNGGTSCVVLTAGGVDCWGGAGAGDLGNGQQNENSAVPVQVEGVGGTGTLSGVTGLTGTFGSYGPTYCALLTSGGVDCWAYGGFGQLGDGQFDSSSVPVHVEGVGGTGTLSGVAGLTGSYGTYGGTYCALLTSGGVDCWGWGNDGQLGDGQFYVNGDDGSAVPVQVEGLGGTGTLSGADRVTAGFEGYCALLASPGVDCWGEGDDGQLGDGQFYMTSPYGSAFPVAVQ